MFIPPATRYRLLLFPDSFDFLVPFHKVDSYTIRLHFVVHFRYRWSDSYIYLFYSLGVLHLYVAFLPMICCSCSFYRYRVGLPFFHHYISILPFYHNAPPPFLRFHSILYSIRFDHFTILFAIHLSSICYSVRRVIPTILVRFIAVGLPHCSLTYVHHCSWHHLVACFPFHLPSTFRFYHHTTVLSYTVLPFCSFLFCHSFLFLPFSSPPVPFYAILPHFHLPVTVCYRYYLRSIRFVHLFVHLPRYSTTYPLRYDLLHFTTALYRTH